MHGFRFMPLNKIRFVPVPREKLNQFVVAETTQDGRVRNFVAVQVKYGKHGAVTCGIEKLSGMPTCGKRPSLALAVADHAAGQQAWIVEDRPAGMRQGIAQFSAFIDRSRSLRGGVAGDSPGKRELLEQP